MNITKFETNKTMSSLDLLEMINSSRKDFGEKEVRNNDFLKRVEDELDDLEAYEIFVSPNNNTGV